jgi:hypothetical protein
MEAYLETKMHGKPSFPFIVYHSVLPKDMKGFPLHWHEEMEIIYVIEGNINITIQNNEYTVHKNEIALIAPESIHSIRQHNDEHAVYFNILFRFSMLSGGEEDPGRPEPTGGLRGYPPGTYGAGRGDGN